MRIRNVRTRLAAFAAAAVLALGAGVAVGAAVGPIDADDPPPRHAPRDTPTHDMDHGSLGATP